MKHDGHEKDWQSASVQLAAGLCRAGPCCVGASPTGLSWGSACPGWDGLGRTAQPAPRDTHITDTSVHTNTALSPGLHDSPALCSQDVTLWCSNGNPSVPAHTPDTSTEKGTSITKQSSSHILSHPKLKSICHLTPEPCGCRFHWTAGHPDHSNTGCHFTTTWSTQAAQRPFLDEN